MSMAFSSDCPAPANTFKAGNAEAYELQVVRRSRRLAPLLIRFGGLADGDLIRAAEHAGFAVMVTADQNIQYQQNLPEGSSRLSC